MKSENQRILEQITSDCSLELFENYNVSFVAVDALSALVVPIHLCAAIGFSGPAIKGTLLLASSEGPLKASCPMEASTYRDWIAELANQLCGRIKTQLIQRGAEIYLATPLVIRGDNISPVPRSDDYLPIVLQGETGQVRLWVDGQFLKGFELPEIAEQTDDCMDEGEGLFF
jgi:CheY-specific phosphatase CheX